ncbi:hypothetical protein TNCV_3393631 [Trichonephila clavipes]|nr:hypothetical protein TNCV_3393631 [Trichonephila clavipes]
MKYHHPGFPSVKKSKTLMSATKVTIFWNASGVLYTEILTEGVTVNSDRDTVQYYDHSSKTGKKRLSVSSLQCKTALQWLHAQIPSGGRGSRVVWYMGRPSETMHVKSGSSSRWCGVVPSPTPCPDLAPSDLRLFPKLKETLHGTVGGEYSPVFCIRDSAQKTFGPTDLTSTYPVCTRRVFGGIEPKPSGLESDALTTRLPTALHCL